MLVKINCQLTASRRDDLLGVPVRDYLFLIDQGKKADPNWEMRHSKAWGPRLHKKEKVNVHIHLSLIPDQQSCPNDSPAGCDELYPLKP